MKRALCVGINDYPGRENDLWGCVNDAKSWMEYFKLDGFETVRLMLNEAATSVNIRASLKELLTASKQGDVFAFTYSGHGTSVYDENGDEMDGYDEALYVYDGILLDDELQEIFALTPKGVHVVVVADSCFSGTITRAMVVNTAKRRYVRTHNTFGIKRRKSLLQKAEMVEVVLTGCSDDEYSYDAIIGGQFNGAFSYHALSCLKSDMNYEEWYAEIRKALPSQDYPQTPQLEGSAKNKTHIVFSPFFVETPQPEPEPEPSVSFWSWLINWFKNLFT